MEQVAMNRTFRVKHNNNGRLFTVVDVVTSDQGTLFLGFWRDNNEFGFLLPEEVAFYEWADPITDSHCNLCCGN
jgi:hypothetical protein